MSSTHFPISRMVFETNVSRHVTVVTSCVHGPAHHIDHSSYVRGNFYSTFTLCSTYKAVPAVGIFASNASLFKNMPLYLSAAHADLCVPKNP